MKDGYEFDRMLDSEIAEYTDNCDLFGLLSDEEKHKKERENTDETDI